MNPLDAQGATAQDIDTVARLVQQGVLWVDIEGAWVSPEVTVAGAKLILYAAGGASDEAD